MLGHEAVARVVQSRSSRFKTGDLIVPIVRRPDPVPCVACAAGEWDMCRNGLYTERGIFKRDGFASERFTVEDDFAIRVDDGLGELAVLLEPCSIVAKAFEQCDVILTPTAPSAAFGIGETTDPLAMYLNDVFAVPASLAVLPAMSIPGGLDAQGLPLGLHLIGNELDEQMVLNAGLAIEERAGFTARPEKWW